MEIIIADDGSNNSTSELIKSCSSLTDIPIIHSFQPDIGFRLARSRNLAALKARGDWIIFLDGDCVLPRNFVGSLARLARGDSVVIGSRKLLNVDVTRHLLECSPSYRSMERHFSGRKFLRIPLGFLRRFPRRSWKNGRGFMVALCRKQFFRLEGFDETFSAWGLEDSEFFVRSGRAGLILCDSRYATSVVHLHHKESDASTSSVNLAKFKSLLNEPERYLPLSSCIECGFLK